jgi:hypothetical protein
MRSLTATTMLAMMVITPVLDAQAQSVGFPGSPYALPGTRPPDALDEARDLATRPLNPLPVPGLPAEQYVPEERAHSFELGRDVVVPGHYAQQAPDGRVIEPPMTIPDPNGGPPAFIPGGERSPGSIP